MTQTIEVMALGPDAYLWANPYGGLYSSAPNWMDSTTGTVAANVPGAANAVSVTGGTNDNFTNIVGTGAAGQLSINNDVLLWGAITVGGTLTLGSSADLDLDGKANLGAGTLDLLSGASLEVGGGSTLELTGTATLAGGFLAAMDGSTVRLGGLVANGINTGYVLATGVIAVDDDSSLEVGTTGGAALGAITIDTGQSAAISGTIDGNVIVNGTLGVQGYGALVIDASDPFGSAQSIAGSGTLVMSENSLLILGVADSAGIRFGGPAGTLDMDVLPSGTISGFTSGDVIELSVGKTVLATGLSYTQTSNSVATLTLTRGGSAVGTLTLAGNYSGDLFHLGFDSAGDGIITLQTVGSAVAQPSLVVGTAGNDTLCATANNQTLTGLGGNDTLGAGAFTGIDFKDTSADLNGSTITSFGSSDTIDLTDMKLSTATVTYKSEAAGPAALTVTDGTHVATIAISLSAGLGVGEFATSTDGASGTDVKFLVANSDAYLFDGTPGGAYGTPSEWLDTTTGTTAAVAPSFGNGVTLTGGAGYIDVTGNGAAASLAASQDVLLWGSLIVGSMLAGVSGALTQSGTLALDGGADLQLAGTASVGGLIEIGGGSTLSAAAVYFSSNGASLLAIDQSTARFATILGANGSSSGTQYDTSVIGVDAVSSIEFGSAGSAVAGALTIDGGMSVDLAGTIDANVVVNGTLLVAGTLVIAPFGPAAPSVGGTGTIGLSYGDTLTIAGPDSAAIMFRQTGSGGYSSTAETLALLAVMPTGMISGFAAGDAISVALIVTNLAYNQIGNAGRLTLLDGATTVGVLLLSGNYSAAQFQVQPAANGLSSTITYAATPSSVAGSAVNDSSDSYSWNNANGGVWSNAANWLDTTAGATPAAAPGASDAVIISDSTGGWTSQIISGPATAASLTITAAANTILTGVISVAGEFSVTEFGTTSNDVAIERGANVTAGGLDLTSLLRVASASLLTVSGSANGTFISGDLSVGSDSAVRVTGGTSTITGTVAVDSTSSVEFGTAGTATAGTMTIDYGQTVTLQGVATIAANVVVNGNLVVYSGTVGGFGGSVGSITGSGTITIGALGTSGWLVLDASESAAIDFEGYSVNGVGYAFESLNLKGSSRTGTIIGFVAGDTILVGSNVTGAVFTQTSGTQGTLTLTDAAITVSTLTLQGNYAGSLFQVDTNPATGVTTISLQTAPSAAGTAPTGPSSHFYNWTAAGGGSWNNAGNWLDTTNGTTTPYVPGAADVVSIAGSTGTSQYTTVGGNGAAGDFTTTGNVLLNGQINVAGLLHVSPGTDPDGTLAIEAGATLTAGAGAQIFGTLEVGGGSSAVIGGTATLVAASLMVLDGSTVEINQLILDGNSSVIAVDPNSFLKIGTSAATAAGALTVAAGNFPALAGTIYGSVVDNSWIRVNAGGTLLIDMNGTAAYNPYGGAPTVGGLGSLLLLEGSTLGLGVADSAAIAFSGPNGTLELAAIPTGPINNFVPGDEIEVDQAVTGMTYRQVSPSSATLTLIDGAATVGILNLVGNFSGGTTAFHLDTAPNGDTAVITLQSLQVAPAQPGGIFGWSGTDLLTATANNQVIETGGGGDTVNCGSFTGIYIGDFTVNLNGATIQNFNPTDVVDFLDMNPSSATETYAGGVLSVTDGTHAAVLSLGFASTPASGSFHLGSDGASGTRIAWY